jgi:hypothetical protein
LLAEHIPNPLILVWISILKENIIFYFKKQQINFKMQQISLQVVNVAKSTAEVG